MKRPQRSSCPANTTTGNINMIALLPYSYPSQVVKTKTEAARWQDYVRTATFQSINSHIIKNTGTYLVQLSTTVSCAILHYHTFASQYNITVAGATVRLLILHTVVQYSTFYIKCTTVVLYCFLYHHRDRIVPTGNH